MDFARHAEQLMVLRAAAALQKTAELADHAKKGIEHADNAFMKLVEHRKPLAKGVLGVAAALYAKDKIQEAYDRHKGQLRSAATYVPFSQARRQMRELVAAKQVGDYDQYRQAVEQGAV